MKRMMFVLLVLISLIGCSVTPPIILSVTNQTLLPVLVLNIDASVNEVITPGLSEQIVIPSDFGSFTLFYSPDFDAAHHFINGFSCAYLKIPFPDQVVLH